MRCFRCLLLAFILLFSGSGGAQSAQIDSLNRALTQQGEDTTRIRTLIELGRVLSESNLDSGRLYVQRAFEDAQRLDDMDGISFSQYFLARYYTRKGQLDTADVLFKKAIAGRIRLDRYDQAAQMTTERSANLKKLNDLTGAAVQDSLSESYALRSGDSTVLVSVFLELASSAFSGGHLQHAIDYTLRAVDLAAQTQQYFDEVRGLINTAYYYNDLNDVDKAIDYGHRSLETYHTRQLALPGLEAGIHARLGAFYDGRNAHDSAYVHSKKALGLFEELGATYAIGMASRGVGLNLHGMGRSQEARPYLHRSLDIFRSLDIPTQTAYTLSGLINVYQTEEAPDRIVAYAGELQSLIDGGIGDAEFKRDMYWNLSEAYVALGNYRRAYTYRMRYQEAADSLQAVERFRQIDSLETAFRVREKDSQLALQESELQLKNSKLSRQRYIIAAACLGLLLIGLFLWLIHRRSEERKQLNAQLRALDREKTQFFMNTAHELRTPLSLVLAPLEDLLSTIEKGPIRSRLETVDRNARRLLARVNQILNVSRLENTKLELNVTEVSLASFTKRIVGAFESMAHFRSIDLRYAYEAEHEVVVALDAAKTEDILNNLISNALKFTESGGSIDVRVDLDDEGVLRTSVRDTGPGIPLSEQGRIFDRYYQASNEQQNRMGGSGVGLALSKELAELMNGRIELESAPGQGSTFTIVLPLSYRTIGDAPTDSIGGGQTAPKPTMTPSALLANAPSILIAEDDYEMSKYLHSILSSDYRLTMASDGAQALELAQKQHIDLIISDVMMPRMDGFAFKSELQKDEERRRIPFIMLTAWGHEDDRLRGLKLGVDDYITKPFKLAELCARIENLLENRRVRKAAMDIASDVDTAAFENSLVQRAVEIVEENLSNTAFSVRDLSLALNYSSRQVERLLKGATGLSPNAFIRELRLRHAYQLLQSGTYGSVSEVAYAVGFEQPGYFTRRFVDRFGLRPRELIRQRSG